MKHYVLFRFQHYVGYGTCSQDVVPYVIFLCSVSNIDVPYVAPDVTYGSISVYIYIYIEREREREIYMVDATLCLELF